jgi:cyclophilin family peptidyl-prolyl cis-trans isomerase
MKYLLPLLALTLLGAGCNQEQIASFNNNENTTNDSPLSMEQQKAEEEGVGVLTAEEQVNYSDRVGEVITVKKPAGLPSQRVETGSSSKEGPIAIIRTTFGTIKVQLFEEATPGTVKNFVELAKAGFYEGTIFHRIIQGFMIQGGDPLTREQRENIAIHGTGGPGYTFGDEISNHVHEKYVISMANSGPNTNGSQFFITTSSPRHLDGRHAVFGEVIQGQGVIDRLESFEVDENSHPLEDIDILEVEIQE